MEGLMSVRETGAIRDKFGYKAIIVVGVREDGTVDVMSHGKTKADCKIIGDYAQKQFLDHLPPAPFQTWFGWGNGGDPMHVSRVSFRAASVKAQEYLTANTHPDAAAHYDDRLSDKETAQIAAGWDRLKAIHEAGVAE